MKVLRRAELVHARKLGRRVEYTLDVVALDELAQAIGCQGGASVAAGEAQR